MLDPRTYCKAETYTKVREGLQRDELTGIPELGSSQLAGQQAHAPDTHLQLQVSEGGGGAVMAAVDDLVTLNRMGLVLNQIEAVLMLLLVAGNFKIDVAKYAGLNGAGAVHRGHSSEYHLTFGLWTRCCR